MIWYRTRWNAGGKNCRHGNVAATCAHGCLASCTTCISISYAAHLCRQRRSTKAHRSQQFAQRNRTDWKCAIWNPRCVRCRQNRGKLFCWSHWKKCHTTKRSEEHTSELQSLMSISYAVFCLKKKNTN